MRNINAKHLQCQCIHVVSGRSCAPSPYVFGRPLYLFFSCPQFEKNWLRKLRTIALPVYFMNFIFFITALKYQFYTFLNISLCL